LILLITIFTRKIAINAIPKFLFQDFSQFFYKQGVLTGRFFSELGIETPEFANTDHLNYSV